MCFFRYQENTTVSVFVYDKEKKVSRTLKTNYESYSGPTIEIPLRNQSAILKKFYLTFEQILYSSQVVLFLTRYLYINQINTRSDHVATTPMTNIRGMKTVTNSSWETTPKILGSHLSGLIAIMIMSPNSSWPQILSMSCGTYLMEPCPLIV